MLGLRKPNALESKPIEAEPAEEGQRYSERAPAQHSPHGSARFGYSLAVAEGCSPS